MPREISDAGKAFNTFDGVVRQSAQDGATSVLLDEAHVSRGMKDASQSARQQPPQDSAPVPVRQEGCSTAQHGDSAAPPSPPQTRSGDGSVHTSPPTQAMVIIPLMEKPDPETAARLKQETRQFNHAMHHIHTLDLL